MFLYCNKKFSKYLNNWWYAASAAVRLPAVMGYCLCKQVPAGKYTFPVHADLLRADECLPTFVCQISAAVYLFFHQNYVHMLYLECSFDFWKKEQKFQIFDSREGNGSVCSGFDYDVDNINGTHKLRLNRMIHVNQKENTTSSNIFNVFWQDFISSISIPFISKQIYKLLTRLNGVA